MGRAETIAVTFDFAGEVVIGWEGSNGNDGNYGYGYDHSYCLVFEA